MNNEMLSSDIFTHPHGRWQEKIKIKHLLSDEDVPLSVLKEKGKQIAAILSRSHRFENDEIITNFDEGLFDDLEEFNDILSEMYDECDRVRIWVE